MPTPPRPSTARPPGRLTLRRTTGLAMILLTVWITSCSTTSGSSRRWAVVTVKGHEPATIRRTVSEVFAEKGYVENSRRGSWFYERGTSAVGQLLHGGWFNEDGVRERAKLRLIPLAEDTYRIECEAVMVRDAGDSFFEEETRMTSLKRGPYKKILKEVEKRLAHP